MYIESFSLFILIVVIKLPPSNKRTLQFHVILTLSLSICSSHPDDYLLWLYDSRIYIFVVFSFSFSFSYANNLGSFWWCFIVWNAEGGTVAKYTSNKWKNVVELSQKSIAVMVPADRQPAGYEIVWQQKSLSQRKDTPKNSRTLGHTSMQLI